MSDNAEQYYFIRSNRDVVENLPKLAEDDKTFNRNYSFEAQVPGSPPLFFSNSYKEKFKKRGWPILNPLPEVLFNGVNLLVSKDIKEELSKFSIPHLHPHPAVYIHDDGEWHENYWFLTFVDEFDCWDRKTSKYLGDDFDPDEDDDFEVLKFRLNQDLLDSTPLEGRLLFKMGRTSTGMITCHESIKHLFDCSGVELERVSDY
ncbi:MAG: hypothetical protein ACI9Y1_003326 [Lentisphaeria bacterium]|jgi:hypothetical protein